MAAVIGAEVGASPSLSQTVQGRKGGPSWSDPAEALLLGG